MADPVFAESLGRAGARITEIFGRKEAALTALCRYYAEKSEQTLRKKQGRKQGEGYYWTNRTLLAIDSARGFTEQSCDYAGWGLEHTVEYGKWLELANDREHAALEPTVRELAPAFIGDVRKIYAG